MFLNPTRSADKYYHLIANVGGVQFDQVGGTGYGGTWDGTWQVKTSRGKDYWEMEMAIPFAQIDFKPVPGAVLKGPT